MSANLSIPKMPRAGFLALISLVLTFTGAHAQVPDLEALERELAERKRAEAQRAEQARRDAEAAAPKLVLQARFDRVADGVLDKRRNLVWGRADAGLDLDWYRAEGICRTPWRLPSVDELQGLYDAGGVFGRQVGANRRIKPATDLIVLSGSYYWSAQSVEFTYAYSVSLLDGQRYRSGKSSSSGYRALCVRRP